MLNTIILIGIIFTLFLLNTIATKQIYYSHLLSSKEKYRLIIFSWVFPVIGAMVSLSVLKKGVLKHREISNQQLVDNLNKLTQKIDMIREQIEEKQKS